MRYHHQHLRLLSYFKTIVETGSIRSAAKAIGVSNAVVSEALSNLEKQLGVSLLKRTTRRHELTPTGARVFSHAANMVHSAEIALFEGAATGRAYGNLSITASTEVAIAFLPKILPEFQRTYPEVDLRLNVTDQLVDMTMGEDDLAFRTHYIAPTSEINQRSSEEFTRLPLGLSSSAELDWGIIKDTIAIKGTLLGTRSQFDLGIPAINKDDGKSYTVKFERVLELENRVVALALSQQGFGTVLNISPENSPNKFGLNSVMANWDFGSVAVTILQRDKHPSVAAMAFENFTKQHTLGYHDTQN